MMIGKQNFLGKGGDPVSSGFRPPSRQQGGRGLLSSPPQFAPVAPTNRQGPDVAGNMNQAMPNAQFGDAGMRQEQIMPQQWQSATDANFSNSQMQRQEFMPQQGANFNNQQFGGGEAARQPMQPMAQAIPQQAPQMTDRQQTRQQFLMRQGRQDEARAMQPMPQKSGGFMIGNQPQGGYNPPQAAPRQVPSAMPMRRR